MKQQRRPRLGLRAALTLVVAIAVALCAVGATRGAAVKSRPTVSTKVMVEGLKAIQYPVARPKRLTCRGLGTAVKGRYTSFRCVAVVKHRRRRFYTRAVAKGGWLCAGKASSGCAVLKRGFFPTSAADNQGWQEIAVAGWLQAHRVKASRGVAISCTSLRSPMTCTLRKNPPVTVVLTYQKTRAGYVETASRS